MKTAPTANSSEAQEICFRCHFVGLGSQLSAKKAHCPVCGFPLIVNSANVALERNELDELFERESDVAKLAAPAMMRALPGVTPPKPKRAPRRVVMAAKPTPTVAPSSLPVVPMLMTVPGAPRRKVRGIKRLLHEIAAGGLLVAGILLVLGVAGVL